MIKLKNERFNPSTIKKAAALAIAITFGTVSAADNVPASTSPPGGLSVSETPMFVVTGWDDNAAADGVAWVKSLFEGRRNPEGRGNPALFDGQEIGTSFYLITNKLAGSPDLVAEIQEMVDSPHLIENHTKDHLNGLFMGLNWDWNAFSDSIPKMPYEDWYNNYIGVGKSDIINQIGVDDSYHLNTGVRHPYLAFSKNSLQAVKDQGYLYDCSAWAWTSTTGRDIAWPYTLDNGISWDANTDAFVPGLWEVPVYMTQYPTDDKCEEYGIEPGFIERQGKSAAGGMDYSLFVSEKLTGPEFLAVLKHNFDLRRNGDRAPFTFGGHSGYYGESSDHSDLETLENMRQAWVDFLDYAQSFDDVRVVTATQLIEWMRSPVGLNDEVTSTVQQNSINNQINNYSLTIRNSSDLHLSVPESGTYSISIYTSNGRMINSISGQTLHQGENMINLGTELNHNFYLIEVTSIAGTVVLKGMNI